MSALVTDPLGYGIDVDCGPNGLSPSFALISGQTTLAQQTYRRITTGRGVLFFHQGDGKDLRQYLAQGFTTTTLVGIQTDLQQEILKDERIDQALISLSYSPQTQALTLTIYVSPKNGTPFKLVLLVTQLTVQLLNGA